ncbi:MAG: peptide chain release factor 1 [Verrucomicrobiota bacterium]|jgi:peptide chain release factor 1|nr:peptide chain release factor 1 [Verrucomicrobiota bacterium]MDK2964337.1 peptide chain release factor 1 [Verrucomicrobiota bacterium]
MINKAYLENLLRRIAELEAAMSAPGVAANPQKMKALMGDYLHQKKIAAVVERFLALQDAVAESRTILDDPDADAELREMAEMELAESEERLPAAEKEVMVALLPPDPSDSKNVIMEIRAGTGGDEASIFAGDLYRMYSRYAENKGLKISLMDLSLSEVGGYKEVVFSVEGDDVYKKLKYESGTHRVQRVPETETQGRIHTSAATVAVLAEAEEVDVEIKTEDLKIDTYRASGAGGQHVNTTDSAIRITHLPTGTVVQCQDERSQHKNKAQAMRVLRARLYDLQQQQIESKQAAARRSQVGTGDRSEKIRTYNYPQNRLTDHRINLTLYKLDRVMEGALDEIFDALYEHDVELKIKAQTDKIG